jgi:dTDP-4-dehydrorhamnose reductase
VAARYPWIEYYTPVNEPCTTARFAGLYGVWYPHGRDDRTFVQALLNQCRAVVLSMRAIRAVNPDAKLVQTDDLGKTYSTPEMATVAEFYNERRWLAWDLLCGMVGPEHPLWNYLTKTGIAAKNSCGSARTPARRTSSASTTTSPASAGSITARTAIPAHHRGVADGIPCADIEASRALATPTPASRPLLHEIWDRYRIPLAVTEAHIDANREDQLRWLLEIWEAAKEVARAASTCAPSPSGRCSARSTGTASSREQRLLRTRPLRRALARTAPDRAGAHDARTVVRHAAVAPGAARPGLVAPAGPLLCQPVATPDALTSITADGHTLVGTGTPARS